MCCQPPGHYEKTCLNVDDGHFSNLNKTNIWLLTQSPRLNMQTLQAGSTLLCRLQIREDINPSPRYSEPPLLMLICRKAESRHIYILDKYYHWVCSWLAGLLTSINIISSMSAARRATWAPPSSSPSVTSMTTGVHRVALSSQRWKDTRSRRYGRRSRARPASVTEECFDIRAWHDFVWVVCWPSHHRTFRCWWRGDVSRSLVEEHQRCPEIVHQKFGVRHESILHRAALNRRKATKYF